MQYYLGQLTLAAFNFAPRGWAMCNGQLLGINQNQALFSLLGTTFGGDGRTTFGLPDMRGRIAVSSGADGAGGTWQLGEMLGQESHTLLISEIPPHTHLMSATSNSGTSGSPVGAMMGNNSQNPYSGAGGAIMSGPTSLFGGNLPHNNLGPTLTLNWIIALSGIFPSRN